MAIPRKHAQLIEASNVKTFFHDSVMSAMANQRYQAGEDTIAYVVNLLADFTRTDRLYEWTQDGYALKPLALLLGEAIEARDTRQRYYTLRRLGDVALFISGLFSDSLRRKLVNVDYYVSMGGTAYGYLSESIRSSNVTEGESEVFEELATNFTKFVSLLEEVVDSAHVADDSDVIRWYDIWVTTGSRRAARVLRQHGIHIMEQPEARPQH